MSLVSPRPRSNIVTLQSTCGFQVSARRGPGNMTPGGSRTVPPFAETYSRRLMRSILVAYMEPAQTGHRVMRRAMLFASTTLCCGSAFRCPLHSSCRVWVVASGTCRRLTMVVLHHTACRKAASGLGGHLAIVCMAGEMCAPFGLSFRGLAFCPWRHKG